MIKKAIKFIALFLIVAVACFAVIHCKLISYSTFTETNFLFTFLGVFIGFALTLYTYIISMFENIKDKINLKYKNDEAMRVRKLELIPEIHIQIKENIQILIYAIIFVVVVSIFNTPINDFIVYVLEVFDIVSVEASHIVDSLLLATFLLSIWSLKDIINASFAISDYIINTK